MMSNTHTHIYDRLIEMMKTIQDMGMKFDKETKTLKRTQAEMKIE